MSRVVRIVWKDLDVQPLLSPSSVAGRCDEEQLVLARELGARGSRASVGHSDPATDPGADARAVLAGVPEWWETVASLHGLSGRWLDVDFAVEAEPPTLSPGGIAPADLRGLAPIDVGAAYSAALDEAVRARHGRHYTPGVLADRLWEGVRTALGHRRAPRRLAGLVRDPACGAGALLLPPLREHVLGHAASDPRDVIAGTSDLIEGIDSDPVAVWIANVMFAAELLPLLARIPAAHRRPVPALARTDDGLTPGDRRARAVLMNPPYGRVRLAHTERARWHRYLYGHANLYGLFIASGIEALDDGGVLGAVVPTSFLAGRYFTALRGELAHQAPLCDLTFVELRGGVFAGVLQETCLATFSRRRTRRASIASINGVVSDVARVVSPRGTRPWLLPRRSGDANVAEAAASMPATLGSLGWRVRTGPLVWNRRRADLRSTGAVGRVRVVWAADLDGGKLHQDPARDRHRWIALRPADERVLVLDEPAVLVQRTTAPEQHRRIVCADFDRRALVSWGGRVVVENHVNVIQSMIEAPPISLGALAAVLSTSAVDRVMRCISGSVAVSAYELESLPLPDAKTLASWEALREGELEAAVASSYRLDGS